VSVATLERPEPDVAVLTLDRPEVRNAIGTETWPLVIEHLSTLRNAELRALVVTGRGNFCSGGDLHDQGLENGGVRAAGVPGRLGGRRAYREKRPPRFRRPAAPAPDPFP
jgi:enoyl-CoA hydratase/carnithine racemase